MVKKNPAPQSIDGIVRKKTKVASVKRSPHLQRQTSMDVTRPFISLRPGATSKPAATTRPALPIEPSAEVEIVKGVVIPKLRQIRVPKALRADVVVKLPRKWSVRANLFLLVQYLGLAVIAVAGAYSTGIGQWFVLAYAVYVLITRQDSRVSFGIALFILVSVPFFQVINQPGVANNMAVYVYELLVVGTVQALIELRKDNVKA